MFLTGSFALFGPNNFPFAFNSVAGGDFAAAIAAGNPVIGKGNSSHPGTTRLLAEEALAATEDTGMPAATVQLIYRTSHQVGAEMVSHSKIGATGYTGSRGAGLVLKETADRAGKPIYLELSSINPVVILPGALAERGAEIADEFDRTQELVDQVLGQHTPMRRTPPRPSDSACTATASSSPEAPWWPRRMRIAASGRPRHRGGPRARSSPRAAPGTERAVPPRAARCL